MSTKETINDEKNKNNLTNNPENNKPKDDDEDEEEEEKEGFFARMKRGIRHAWYSPIGRKVRKTIGGAAVVFGTGFLCFKAGQYSVTGIADDEVHESDDTTTPLLGQGDQNDAPLDK